MDTGTIKRLTTDFCTIKLSLAIQLMNVTDCFKATLGVFPPQC